MIWPCVSITPLGSDVVPLVKRISARSSVPIAGGPETDRPASGSGSRPASSTLRMGTSSCSSEPTVDALAGEQERRPGPAPDADGDVGLHAQVERHDDRAQAPDREVGRHQPWVVL